MADYLRSISKVSCFNSKKVNIPESVLKYFFWFNNLGRNVNSQMHIKSHEKPLILLGKFKITYDTRSEFFNHIIFRSPELKITVYGSFRRIKNNILYNKHCELTYDTYDLSTT
jgi:hypothetical protein